MPENAAIVVAAVATAAAAAAAFAVMHMRGQASRKQPGRRRDVAGDAARYVAQASVSGAGLEDSATLVKAATEHAELTVLPGDAPDDDLWRLLELERRLHLRPPEPGEHSSDHSSDFSSESGSEYSSDECTRTTAWFQKMDAEANRTRGDGGMVRIHPHPTLAPQPSHPNPHVHPIPNPRSWSPPPIVHSSRVRKTAARDAIWQPPRAMLRVGSAQDRRPRCRMTCGCFNLQEMPIRINV